MTRKLLCVKLITESEVKPMTRQEEVNAICRSTRSIRSILTGIDYSSKDFVDPLCFEDDEVKEEILEAIEIANQQLKELKKFIKKMKV